MDGQRIDSTSVDEIGRTPMQIKVLIALLLVNLLAAISIRSAQSLSWAFFVSEFSIASALVALYNSSLARRVIVVSCVSLLCYSPFFFAVSIRAGLHESLAISAMVVFAGSE